MVQLQEQFSVTFLLQSICPSPFGNFTLILPFFWSPPKIYPNEVVSWDPPMAKPNKHFHQTSKPLIMNTLQWLCAIPCPLWCDDHFGRQNHAVNIIVLLQSLVGERVGQLKDEVWRLDSVRHHRGLEDEVCVVVGLAVHQGGRGPWAPPSFAPPPPSPRLWHHYPILLLRSNRTQNHVRHFSLMSILNMTMMFSVFDRVVFSHHTTVLISSSSVALQCLITLDLSFHPRLKILDSI